MTRPSSTTTSRSQEGVTGARRRGRATPRRRRRRWRTTTTTTPRRRCKRWLKRWRTTKTIPRRKRWRTTKTIPRLKRWRTTTTTPRQRRTRRLRTRTTATTTPHWRTTAASPSSRPLSSSFVSISLTPPPYTTTSISDRQLPDPSILLPFALPPLVVRLPPQQAGRLCFEAGQGEEEIVVLLGLGWIKGFSKRSPPTYSFCDNNGEEVTSFPFPRYTIVFVFRKPRRRVYSGRERHTRGGGGGESDREPRICSFAVRKGWST